MLSKLLLTHTTNRPIQSNVVDASLCSSYITRILLVPILELEYLLLSVLRIVVKIDLGIHAHHYKE